MTSARSRPQYSQGHAQTITRRNFARKMVDFGPIEVFPMPANFPSLIVRFGTFAVNFQTMELRPRGQEIKLQEQPLQVLAALLERPGEMVTREELQKKPRPEDTFDDFHYSLNAAIVGAVPAEEQRQKPSTGPQME